MRKKLACIFGDSVMKGVVLDDCGVKYKTLQLEGLAQFEDELGLELVNRSRFGSTIQKGFANLKQYVEKNQEMRYAILEFGGNDCDFHWEEVAATPQLKHEPKTPLPQFKSTYREMLAYLKEHDIQPIMMNLPPVDGERYLSFLVARGLSRDGILAHIKTADQISRFQELYSLTVERLAYETDTLLVDCRSAFLDRLDIRETICDDGIHPTRKGHGLIYQSFLDFLKTLPMEVLEELRAEPRLSLLEA